MTIHRLELAKSIVEQYPEAVELHQQGFRTGCTSAVLTKLGITGFRFSQTAQDIVRIAGRNGYSVRPRQSILSRGRKGTSVARLSQSKLNPRSFYLIHVPGHVLLIRGDKAVLADTDPRPKGDRRQIKHIWEIRKGRTGCFF